MTSAKSLWDPQELEDRDEVADQVHRDYELLGSELHSLYDEFEKLTKKAPATRLTALALQTINALIGDSKRLMSGDRYVDRISEFVAAGENPVNSDVLLILATLVSALNRFREAWYPVWDDLEII